MIYALLGCRLQRACVELGHASQYHIDMHTVLPCSHNHVYLSSMSTTKLPQMPNLLPTTKDDQNIQSPSNIPKAHYVDLAKFYWSFRPKTWQEIRREWREGDRKRVVFFFCSSWVVGISVGILLGWGSKYVQWWWVTGDGRWWVNRGGC
jgi:hypothetical protein